VRELVDKPGKNRLKKQSSVLLQLAYGQFNLRSWAVLDEMPRLILDRKAWARPGRMHKTYQVWHR